MSSQQKDKTTNATTAILAKAFQLNDLRGWISKKLVVPPGRTGIAVFRDGKTDLFSPGENRVITDLDRLLGKGAGFWAGYLPAENFTATISINNLLSGDDKLIDLNLLCDVSVEDNRKFFVELVIPQRELPAGSLIIDMSELFYAFASVVRNYTADDLISGNLDSELRQKANLLLTNLLPNKGIQLEDIIMISIWNQEDRLIIREQADALNQKLKDLEFEQKIANAKTQEELEEAFKENGISIPKKSGFFPISLGEKNDDKLKNWSESVRKSELPGHNFRLRSLLIKKELDSVNRLDTPILKHWWVPRVLWMVFSLLAGIAATFYLKKASATYEWLTRSEFYYTIWIAILGFNIDGIFKLFKKWEETFANVEQPASILGLDDIRFKDPQAIDNIIRDQSQMEINRQWEILNEVRGKVYRSGNENLALEIKQLERKLENFIPQLKDEKVGKPIYLFDDIKISKASWSHCLDHEEVLLIKAAMLTQSAQEIQSLLAENQSINESLAKFEAEFDVFTSDFMSRNRIIHTKTIC
jgi:hypothetical protein